MLAFVIVWISFLADWFCRLHSRQDCHSFPRIQAAVRGCCLSLLWTASAWRSQRLAHSVLRYWWSIHLYLTWDLYSSTSTGSIYHQAWSQLQYPLQKCFPAHHHLFFSGKEDIKTGCATYNLKIFYIFFVYHLYYLVILHLGCDQFCCKHL